MATGGPLSLCVMSTTQDNEDDLNFTFPDTPSGLRGMSDDDLAKLFRKFSYANAYTPFNKVEHELSFRLLASLHEFRRAADRSSGVLILLTVVLVVLTAAILWLTYQLD